MRLDIELVDAIPAGTRRPENRRALLALDVDLDDHARAASESDCFREHVSESLDADALGADLNPLNASGGWSA